MWEAVRSNRRKSYFLLFMLAATLAGLGWAIGRQFGTPWIVLAIVAPILSRLLYLAISRRREYLADASAVELTRYPEGLASALEKISGDTESTENGN